MPKVSEIYFAAPVEADRQVFSPADVFAAGEQNHHISNTAYPIVHSQTFKPYRLERALHRETVERAFADAPDICLYSHIPFCETRCFFCEYTVVGKSELERTRDYMTALNRETEMYAELLGPRTLWGWDIGGGTPSFPPAEFIAEHIDVVKHNFQLSPDFAISIETTPRIASLEPDKIHAYRQMGIERISMGVQVTQPDLLKALGRDTNGLEHHYRATEHIRAAGFEKFNLDLMYGFADQSPESWRATLEHAIRLDPDYITLYRMRYKLTRISHQAERVTLDMARQHAKIAKEMLFSAGYSANPGKNTYSRTSGDTGTSKYLTHRVIEGRPYLGLGLGAQTYSPTTIAYNSGAAGKNLTPYLRDIEKGLLPIQDLYDLPAAHMMAKMIAVSFYFGEINLTAFKERFGQNLEEAYGPAVEFAISEGLMSYTESVNGREIALSGKTCLSLTEKGARHFNGTIALFFAPSVQGYLIRPSSTSGPASSTSGPASSN
ncbi:coproporphyrinogen-III oxidase family protein [Turneriella parva]|uniref:Radical SAM domain protein n=1 Tax=Turneriella parva (strain ATCC BAA-1111 / DSM 21527 / NCTC 11395 / H) TaxID=869212 RepID=I4B0U6_TURPD|nr:radical SAM protein [Turneriella parva]AFM10903.1 Radical SAM domain protein [Turneriella parva DSM 21527]